MYQLCKCYSIWRWKKFLEAKVILTIKLQTFSNLDILNNMNFKANWINISTRIIRACSKVLLQNEDSKKDLEGFLLDSEQL